MPDASDAPRRAPARPPLRRLAIVLGIWIVVAGGALLIAGALDSPVGEGARDEAVAVAPEVGAGVTTPGSPGTTTGGDGAASRLPPLALVLDHALPASITSLAPAKQLETLRTQGIATKDPERFVELGSLLQLLGDGASAEFSYRSALRFDPGNVGAKVGLALVEGAAGDTGLVAAARSLQELAAANPQSQLVAFNQGWVEIYRRRGATARTAWERTIALGPGTRLGRTATALLRTLENGSAGRNP